MAQLAVPFSREADRAALSHSLSFDQRLRPETLRTAMATAFFCPTRTRQTFEQTFPASDAVSIDIERESHDIGAQEFLA